MFLPEVREFIRDTMPREDENKQYVMNYFNDPRPGAARRLPGGRCRYKGGHGVF